MTQKARQWQQNIRLMMVSNNLHGLNQETPYLISLSNDYDIVFVQEHWLAPFDLNCLDKINDSMVCYPSSAPGDVISQTRLQSRPFAGLDVFVKNSLAVSCSVVTSGTHHYHISVWRYSTD